MNVLGLYPVLCICLTLDNRGESKPVRAPQAFFGLRTPYLLFLLIRSWSLVFEHNSKYDRSRFTQVSITPRAAEGLILLSCVRRKIRNKTRSFGIQ